MKRVSFRKYKNFFNEHPELLKKGTKFSNYEVSTYKGSNSNDKRLIHKGSSYKGSNSNDKRPIYHSSFYNGSFHTGPVNVMSINNSIVGSASISTVFNLAQIYNVKICDYPPAPPQLSPLLEQYENLPSGCGTKYITDVPSDFPIKYRQDESQIKVVEIATTCYVNPINEPNISYHYPIEILKLYPSRILMSLIQHTYFNPDHPENHSIYIASENPLRVFVKDSVTEWVVEEGRDAEESIRSLCSYIVRKSEDIIYNNMYRVRDISNNPIKLKNCPNASQRPLLDELEPCYKIIAKNYPMCYDKYLTVQEFVYLFKRNRHVVAKTLLIEKNK